jgi:hypothetical protein
MYSLRSKRSIHKGTVDASRYDLRLLYAGAQWILAELLALTQGITMEEAGRLVEHVQTPVTGLVEVLHGRRLVHGTLTVRQEIVVLLFSHYPDAVTTGEITSALERRSAGSVRNELSRLWKAKLLQRSDTGYVLTQAGVREAGEIVRDHTE